MAVTQSDFLRSGGRVSSPSGARFTVSPLHANRFGALLSDLERAGVTIDPSQSGGFNPRNIAGTNVPSQHAFGRAVDINWRDNPRNGPPADMAEISRRTLEHEMGGTAPPVTQIHPWLAREVAARHGLTWGGDWRNPDPMHFEVARGNLPPVPVQGRSITAFAGAQPAAAPAPPPVSAPTPAVPQATGPWQTTVSREVEPSPTVNAFAKAMANFEPEQARINPTAMGLLSSLPPPMAPSAAGWVSNPFQQQRGAGMQRAQFGLT